MRNRGKPESIQDAALKEIIKYHEEAIITSCIILVDDFLNGLTDLHGIGDEKNFIISHNVFFRPK